MIHEKFTFQEASGAPLVSGNGEILGIFSRGIQPCGNVTGVGIYTNISHYMNWINSTVNSTVNGDQSMQTYKIFSKWLSH